MSSTLQSSFESKMETKIEKRIKIENMFSFKNKLKYLRFFSSNHVLARFADHKLHLRIKRGAKPAS